MVIWKKRPIYKVRVVEKLILHTKVSWKKSQVKQVHNIREKTDKLKCENKLVN